MLRALLWKDLRVSRLPLLAGVVLLIAPYFLAGVTAMGAPVGPSGGDGVMWSGVVVLGSMYSMAFSQLTLAILAGNLIAGERVDRSAEFLGYLPPSRSRILLSKSLVLLGASVIIIGTNVVGWLTGMSMLPIPASGTETMTLGGLLKIAFIGLGAAGVGWAASAKMEATGPPVLLAISTPMVVYGAFFGTYMAFDWSIAELSGDAVLLTCGIVGAVFFVLGWIYFVRRVEP